MTIADHLNRSDLKLDTPTNLTDEQLEQMRDQYATLEPIEFRETVEEGVAGLMTQVAADHPDQPVAANAMQVAARISRTLHQYEPRPQGAAELYENAMQVLFEQFPASAEADDQRVYYAFSQFQANGAFDKAAELYGQHPFGHRDYFEAQSLRLFCLTQVAQQEQGTAAADACDGIPRGRTATITRV